MGVEITLRGNACGNISSCSLNEDVISDVCLCIVGLAQRCECTCYHAEVVRKQSRGQGFTGVKCRCR